MLSVALIGLLGGFITGISPCILPVLPVIFLAGGRTGGAVAAPVPEKVAVAVGGGAGADPPPPSPVRAEPRNLRPYAVIAGLVLSFSFFTLLGSLILGALGLPDNILRIVGTVLLVAIGLGLIFPKFEEILERPFARIPQRQANAEGSAFVLGLGLGLLFVPCAGPVLAAITVAASTGKIGLETVLLTVTFAIGVAIPLLGFALAGARVAERVKAFRTRQRKVRVGIGVVLIAMALLLNTTIIQVLQRAIPDYTRPLSEQVENNPALRPQLSGLDTDQNRLLSRCTEGDPAQLKDCGQAQPFENIAKWINTPDGQAIDVNALHGKVVLIDFWTYSCINCLRTVPHITAWDRAYRAAGLQVVGVHTPEFAFEKDPGNVEAAVRRENIEYPVAMDNQISTWNNYRNRYWPAQYLIDATGQVRYIKLGEGDYDRTESLIRQLLQDAKPGVVLPGPTAVAATTPEFDQITGEQFLGSGGKKSYTGERYVASTPHAYPLAADIPEGSYGIGGTWTAENNFLRAGPDGLIRLNYRARTVGMVLGGTGTVTVDDGGKQRTITVSGAPNLYPISKGQDLVDGDLTVRASEGIEAYTFAFG